MISLKQSTPFGGTVFCDDIRAEVSGKSSFIGIYGEAINFHGAFPGVLPKFAFAVSYFERPGESTDPVELRIYMPGLPDDEPAMRGMLPMEEARSSAAQINDDDFEDRLIGIRAHFIVAPLELKAEGRIRVRAYRGNEEIKLGTIKVTRTDDPAIQLEPMKVEI